MLLVEMTINSTVHRISNTSLALEQYWSPTIASMADIKIATRTPHGGYAEPVYGVMEVTPNLFDGDWPPPLSCPVVVKLALTSEADAVTLFEGTAHRQASNRDGIVFDLYGQDFPQTVTGQVYSGTLISIFWDQCIILGLSLILVTSRNPAVEYTPGGETVLLDDLSNIAAFFSHCFYIEAGTMYLIDMLIDNGSRAYTEFDFFPSRYIDPVPTAMLTAGTNQLAGSYKYGQTQSITPVCHTVAANINAALADIKTILERPRIELHTPLAEPPVIGERISWLDESMHRPLNAWARTRSVNWDFDQELCVLEGEGGLSA